MRSLDDLIEIQWELAGAYWHFVHALEPSRTVLLSELLTDPSAPQRLRVAGWFNQQLFAQRLEAMCEYFAHLPCYEALRKKTSLIFFQANCKQEDQLAHENHMQRCFYRSQFGGLSPQIHYLLTHTSFSWKMEGSWEERDLVITPMSPFSNLGDGGLYQKRPRFRVHSGSVIGYRIPDYSALLRVSGGTATDYMARCVVHDIGHGMLPEVPSDNEPLHNAIMVRAIGAERIRHDDPWENLVHGECADPLFFLHVRDYFELALPHLSALDPTLRAFAVALWRIYGNKDARAARRKLWNIPSKKRGHRAEQRVCEVMQEMERDCFTRYNQQLVPRRKK